VINLDTTATGVGAKARIDWLNKQFAKIDVQLVVRSTDYNRFQEKVRKGAVQLFYWGWNADYPGPGELHVPAARASRARSSRAAKTRRTTPATTMTRLFERMKTMDNGPQRQEIIDRMNRILHRDAPWVWGFHPKDYSLRHAWLLNRKPIKGRRQHAEVPAGRCVPCAPAPCRVESSGGLALAAGGPGAGRRDMARLARLPSPRHAGA
jgi:oligopeptide transport system substrate-binding protein